MNKILKSILGYFKLKPPHVCEFKCLGFRLHYGQFTKITDIFDEPTYYHYRDTKKAEEWMSKGFKSAFIYNSWWGCPCGKHGVTHYFFLCHPFEKDKYKNRRYGEEIAGWNSQRRLQ